MEQVAIFIDVAWLTAEAAPLFGGQAPEPDAAAAIAALRARVRAAVPGARLLRVYWYGEAPGAIADLKARSDRTIAEDLTALAQNHAIADALLMAGEVDPAAIEAAQMHGVRLHAAGIGGESPLAALTDTATVWGRGDLGWLAPKPTATSAAEFERVLEERIDREIEALLDEDIDSILAYAEFSNGRVPQAFDRPMLSRLGAACSRTLTEKERETFRKRLIAELRLELEPIDEDEPAAD